MDLERYERVRGDSTPFTLTLTNSTGDPVNASLYSWRIAAKKKVKDAEFTLEARSGTGTSAGFVTFDISEDDWYNMALGEHTFEIEGCLYGTYKPQIKRQFIMTLFQEILPNQDPPI